MTDGLQVLLSLSSKSWPISPSLQKFWDNNNLSILHSVVYDLLRQLVF